MTDFEMTRLCAEAMGNDAWTDINGRWYCHVRGQETIFAPLIDDAQAMALVKKLGIDLNRAIVECVAKMQEAKNV